MFLRLFKHLLPRARAWSITLPGRLREFFAGLAAALGDPIRLYLDLIMLDLFPDTTRELEAWEGQFDLRYTTGLTETQRRARLSGAWKALGGQSPKYIQDTLRGAGFDVYVHEWWIPGTEPPLGVHACAIPYNPFLYLFPTTTGTPGGVECGEALAECGEAFAECGNVSTLLGYPLVNKLIRTSFAYVVECAEPVAECGEPIAEAGDRGPFFDEPVIYSIPADSTMWPYFMYIGGATFGTLASVPADRRDEFEELILKIAPVHVWTGVMVVYT